MAETRGIRVQFRGGSGKLFSRNIFAEDGASHGIDELGISETRYRHASAVSPKGAPYSSRPFFVNKKRTQRAGIEIWSFNAHRDLVRQ